MLNIGRLRRAAGLTQEELAARIGVRRGALAMWELGKSWPPAQILPALAENLDCKIEDLYTDSNSDGGACPCGTGA